MDSGQRRALGLALAQVAPWTRRADVGPAAVAAGECDRCGTRPRWVETCGAQPWATICRDCLLEVGTNAFCDGHHDDAVDHITTARGLDDDWATVTRLAWVATGEVAPDRAWLSLAAASVRRPAVRACLPPADMP